MTLPATTTPKLTACYIRVTQQDSERYSPDAQRAEFLEIAKRRTWQPIRVFQEPRHVSGQHGEDKREALREMMSAVRAGLVERVVVRHSDRLGRGHILDELTLELDSLGVELWDFHSQIDTKTAAGRLRTRIEGVFGQFETERTGERVRGAKRNRVHEGYYLGPAPYGFTSQARLRRELRELYRDDDRARIEAQQRIPVSPGLVVDAAEAVVVREIFRLYVEQGWGARQIANHLNKGQMLHRGAAWFGQTIRKVLRDPKVAGWVHFDEDAYVEKKRHSSAPIHQQALFEAKHEAIVDRATWTAAQERMDHNRRIRDTGKENVRPYVLSGYLRCPFGHPMKGKSSGDGNAYYTCTRRGQHGTTGNHPSGCDADPVRADDIEDAVRRELVALVTTPSRVLAVMDAANRQLAADRPGKVAALEEIDAAVGDLQRRRKNIANLMEVADDVAEGKILLERIKDLDTQIRERTRARDEILIAVEAARPRRVTEADVADYLSDLATTFEEPEAFAGFIRVMEVRHHLELVAVSPREVRIRLRLQRPKPTAKNGLRVVADGPEVHLDYVVATVEEAISVDQWVAREQGKHICACPCGAPITIRPIHHAPSKGGIPRYIQGHSRSPMQQIQEQLEAEGYLTRGRAAELLGIGITSLIRWERNGKVVPEQRTYGDRPPINVFKKADIERLASLNAARPGGDPRP
jgi:site-specific DNA recombinase